MAICMACGTLMNNEDAGNHTCDPADVPAVGSPKKWNGMSGYSGATGAEGMSGYSGYSGGV